MLVLWPLFNYIVWNDATDGRLEKKQWNFYEQINQKYADLVVEHYQPGDVIWVHDYHLLLVPNMVRAKLPKARIGLFVHSPFPSSEIFRCLPSNYRMFNIYLIINIHPTFFFPSINNRTTRNSQRDVRCKLGWFPGTQYIFVIHFYDIHILTYNRHMRTQDILFLLQLVY
jgi:hypothetical protein